MRTHRMEPRESVKLIANLMYSRKISGVVAGGKVLAVPLLALFLVPFLIEAAQASQLNRGNYRPAVTQPVNRFPLGGINTFSTNRSKYVPTVNRFPLGGINTFSTNRSKYAPTVNRFPLGGINTFSTNRSNYAPTVNHSVNSGVTQMNNKMYGAGNKGLNINALRGNQTFKQNIGVPRNNATNLNPNLTRITGVNVNNSSQRNVNTKIDFGAGRKKFQY